jgi:CheY-like chemotaxis protein
MASKHRVLIVDDHPDAAEISCTLISMMGHECRIAVSGARAIEEARSFEPDIAILDISLPDVSGYDVARALRAAPAGRSLYLAAMTGWGQPEDLARAYAAGFDRHVLKPADARKLQAILDAAETKATVTSEARRS